MLRYTCGIILVLAICAGTAFAQPSILPKDPDLDKPVTLSVKGEALSDLIPVLRQQTGARLRVTKEIADQKVTIFVDNKPLRDVMSGLETIFNYRWLFTETNGRRSYELLVPIKNKLQNQTYKEALAEAWVNMNKKMSEYAKADINSEDKSASQKALASRLWLSLPDKNRDAVKAGCTIYCDSKSQDIKWKIPNDISEGYAKYYSTNLSADNTDEKIEGINISFVPSVAMFDMVLIEVKAAVRKKIPNASERNGWDLSLDSTLIFAEQIKIDSDDSIIKLSDNGNNPVLDKKINLTSSELMEETGYPLQTELDGKLHANRSDVLSIIHRKLGAQIISDHYSVYELCPPQNSTVREILDKVCGRNVMRGSNEEFIYMRTCTPSAADDAEIPNRILRPCQAVYVKNGYLGLNEMALLSQLSDAQRANLTIISKYLGLGRLGLGFYQGMNPNQSSALQLYASMSPYQRAQAWNTSLDTRMLDNDQQILLLHMFSGKLDEDQSVPLFTDKGMYMTFGKVGIYDPDGRRLDIPVASRSTGLVSLSIRENTREYYSYNESSTAYTMHAVGETASGSTLDETWKKVLEKKPNASVEHMAFERYIRYIFTVNLADGTTRETELNTFVRTPLSKLDLKKVN